MAFVMIVITLRKFFYDLIGLLRILTACRNGILWDPIQDAI